MMCKVLARTKGNSNAHILAQGDQVIELANENHHYILVNSAHPTVGTVILKSIL